MDRIIKPAKRLRGMLSIPGDKSISQRALMLSALAMGETRITHLAPGMDVRSTWTCLEQMGVRIREERDGVIVQGKGGEYAGGSDSHALCKIAEM